MVKQCSPSELSGVVDSLFTRGRGGTRPPTQAAEETSVWPSELSDAAQAGAALRLAKGPKADTFWNHQKFGRPPIIRVGVGWPLSTVQQ